MPRKKILFLGETYRQDAITWMNGLKEFGDFEMLTWELKTPNNGALNRLKRILEYAGSLFKIRKIVQQQAPDMVIAERTTSYGFLAALSGVKPVVIAQQGITDLWPTTSILYPIKKKIQEYAFKKADLIHAWGPIMIPAMKKAKVDLNKVLVLPKGIDLSVFDTAKKIHPNEIKAVVTRTLSPEYKHDIILRAFGKLHEKGLDFQLTIVGDGIQFDFLNELAKKLKIETKVVFVGKMPNSQLSQIVQQSNFYISMPTTEGVSASLFEAMATNCYPIVTDIPGNQSWIDHRKNGQLIPVNDYERLASELIWAIENPSYREQAVTYNRKFIEQNVNYSTNMKMIADRYHELINTTKN